MTERLRPGEVEQNIGVAVLAATGDRVTGAGGAASALTYAANADKGYCIGNIHYSYSAAPAGGKLTITSASDVIFEVDITAAGPGELNFDPPKLSAKNEACVITLAAPGGAVVGKLNASVWLF